MPKVVQGLQVDPPKLQKPFRLLVGGGSGSGKSCFVKRLVEENHFDSSFNQIVYIYPNYLDECPMEFNTEVDIQTIAGLPDRTSLASIEKNTLIILDDMMMETTNSEDIVRLFTVIARKKNISVILIVQNLYQYGKYFRTLRLNSTGIVMFKFYAGVETNTRILRDLGLQSRIPKFLLDNVYSTRYQYIYLDLHPNRQFDNSAVRGNIFEYYPRIYNEMEYVAIPKEDFLKYFTIIKKSKGKYKAKKNEVAIPKELKKLSKKRKRTRSPTPESSTGTSDITTSDSD